MSKGSEVRFLSDGNKKNSSMILRHKILLKSTKGYSFQPVDEIMYFKACDKYAEMHCADESVTIVFHSLSELEVKLCCGERVGPFLFFRVHRQYIAALHFANDWKSADCIEMENGLDVPVSREKVKPLRECLYTIYA